MNDLIARDANDKDSLFELSTSLPEIVLSERQLCDLELILNGGFSPLAGFLNEDDYESVVESMRLSSIKDEATGKGLLWPMPITLDVTQSIASSVKPGEKVVLKDLRDGSSLAILTIESIYKPDKKNEAQKVFRGDPEHPAVNYLLNVAGDYYIGGSVQGLQLPKHYDYTHLRKTPAALRSEFGKLGWDEKKIVAFQTRNPMHRAHRELTVRAAQELGTDGRILIHPVVGLTKPGDIDHHTRVKVYQQIMNKYPEGLATISLLPLAMRMGGDREALWHALIRMNYGVDHFIVGRDHAGPGKNSKGVDFYGPYDAQDLLALLGSELSSKIRIVPFRMVTYLPDEDRYAPIDTIDQTKVKTANISGTELRQRLKDGTDIPGWFSYPEVVKILRESNPPRSKQGFVLLLAVPQELREKIGYAFQSFLNQYEGGRRIVKLPEEQSDPFIINELVKSGAGVIAVAGDVSGVEKLVGSANTVIINERSLEANNSFPLESAKDFESLLTDVASYLTDQGFF